MRDTTKRCCPAQKGVCAPPHLSPAFIDRPLLFPRTSPSRSDRPLLFPHFSFPPTLAWARGVAYSPLEDVCPAPLFPGPLSLGPSSSHLSFPSIIIVDLLVYSELVPAREAKHSGIIFLHGGFKQLENGTWHLAAGLFLGLFLMARRIHDSTVFFLTQFLPSLL